MAECAIGETPLRSTGLGSCVALGLVDRTAGVGGLAHVMLPESTGRSNERPGKFADAAVPNLAEAVVEAGGTWVRLRAKFAGGSDLFEFSGIGERIGERNATAVYRALVEAGIPVEGRDTGGDYGRTVTLDPRTGEMTVETAAGDESTL